MEKGNESPREKEGLRRKCLTNVCTTIRIYKKLVEIREQRAMVCGIATPRVVKHKTAISLSISLTCLFPFQRWRGGLNHFCTGGRDGGFYWIMPVRSLELLLQGSKWANRTFNSCGQLLFNKSRVYDDPRVFLIKTRTNSSGSSDPLFVRTTRVSLVILSVV